jgi:hypothetical protein
MQKDDFSLSNYKRCLEQSLKLGYNFLKISDFFECSMKSEKNIILRHHEIGLHYESDFYILNNKNVKDSIDKAAKIIEYFGNVKVKSICPHEPTRTNCFHLKDINYYQAYDEILFEKYKYISDSSCRWRDGSFYENIQQGHQNLYILTHPYWWYNNSPIENY